MLPLTGVVKNYAWGSPTAIPGILGQVPDGTPQAEYWLGTHPAGPAQLEQGFLDDWLRLNPDALGANPDAHYEGQLPYLMKILAAAKPLSLQAHPTTEQAEAGFAAENAAGIALNDPTRNYKDSHAKPELLIALSEFEALAGFREPAETVRLFEGLELSDELIHPIVGPMLNRSASSALAQVFLDCLTMDDSRRDLLAEVVSAAVRHLNDEDDAMRRFARLAVRLDEFYPNDPSLLAALLLNQVTLQPFQGLAIQAGVLHSYLGGSGIEVMASSDNVLRGGLTAKHIDPRALAEVVTFEAELPPVVEAAQQAEGIWRYPEEAPEFDVWRLAVPAGRRWELPAPERARVLLVCEGHLLLRSDITELELVQGQAAFIPAGEAVQASGDALAFLTASGTH